MMPTSQKLSLQGWSEVICVKGGINLKRDAKQNRLCESLPEHSRPQASRERVV